MEQTRQQYRYTIDYELQGAIRRTHRITNAIIAASGTTSNAVDLAGFGLIGLLLPALTDCDLTFQVAETETGTYRTIYNSDDTVFTVDAGTGNRAIATDHLAPLSAYRWVRVVSSETQEAERILRFIGKM
jgi:hypothetical protein